MGDLGLGSLVAKFEEYFGRRATGGLLILAYIAIAAAAVTAIWKLAILPVLALAAPLFPKPLSFRGFLNLIGILVPIFAAMGAASMALDAYRRRLATDSLERLVPMASDVLDKAEAKLAEAKEMFEDIKAAHVENGVLMDKAQALIDASNLAFGEILESGIKNGRITLDQANEIRSLIAEETAVSNEHRED